MAQIDPDKNVTIRGRLSFPKFTHAEAVAANQKSKFVKADPADVTPEFNLLVEQDQLDKLINHIRDKFLPYTEAQFAAKEKRDVLDPKQVKKVLAFLEAGDWTDTPPLMLIKGISEQNQEKAPECQASIKIIGSKGTDVTLKARVESEDQLLVPDADILTYPVLVPLKDTVFEMYAGAYVSATINLFAFFSSNSVWGISGAATTAFYMGNLEGERFGGGGAAVDEDEIFMD